MAREAALTDRQVKNRLVRLVANACGPARMNTLEGFAESLGCKDGKRLVRELVAAGRLVMINHRKGAKYGPKTGR